MIELMERSEGSVVGVRISGGVTEEDYDRILPELESRIVEHGEIDLLCRFDGWTGIQPEAVWRDMTFHARHFPNVRRLAVVQDREWQGTLARIFGPLTGMETRVFESTDEEGAWTWLQRRAEADRAWTDEDAGRRHARKHRKRIHELASQLRDDAGKLEDAQAKVLFDSAAEVLAGVERSLGRYESRGDSGATS